MEIRIGIKDEADKDKYVLRGEPWRGPEEPEDSELMIWRIVSQEGTEE